MAKLLWVFSNEFRKRDTGISSRFVAFFGLETVKKWARFAIKSNERHFCWIVTSLRYIIFLFTLMIWSFFYFLFYLLLFVCLFCVVVFTNQQNYDSLKGSFAVDQLLSSTCTVAFKVSHPTVYKWIQKTICWKIKVPTFMQGGSCLY